MNWNVCENVRQEHPQVSVNAFVEQVTNDEFIDTFYALDKALIVQENRYVVSPISPRVMYFITMNPMEYHGPNIEEYLEEFIDEVYKVFTFMGMTSVEKANIGCL